jgi:bifunctional DNA-binding transcriptional regulator/antitoxin component of YhaV-PrlF toxin-antitoxin module
MQDFEYRKVQSILGDVSFSIILPKEYAISLGLRKGEFVKVWQTDGKIVIQKA